jgi:hypothetical protein
MERPIGITKRNDVTVPGLFNCANQGDSNFKMPPNLIPDKYARAREAQADETAR